MDNLHNEQTSTPSAAAPPFLQVETFSAGRTRVLTELMGTEICSPDLAPIADRIERHILDAWAHFLHCSPAHNNVHAWWLIQESHAGQRRPVAASGPVGTRLYQPKSLTSDAVWCGLVQWLGCAMGDQLSSPIAIHPQAGWGWMELVQHRPCEEQLQIAQYYRRLGSIAALGWLLGGSDGTGSNFVAAGPYPILVDAEMVLLPGHSAFADPLETEFRRTAFGPCTVVDSDGNTSSLGAAAMAHVRCRHGRHPAAGQPPCLYCHHVPRIDQQPHFVNDYVAQLSDGFAKALEVLYATRQVLLSVCSPLSAFEGATGRVVLRPTAAYGLVRQWLFHGLRSSHRWPDVGNLLSKMPVKHALQDEGRAVFIHDEVRQLCDGDVPRFEMGFDKERLMINGVPAVWFTLSGLARARMRIETLTRSMTEDVARAWTSYVCASLKNVEQRRYEWTSSQ